MVAAAVDAARLAGDDILLLVGSDHGHETVSGVVDIVAELVAAGLKDDAESRDVVVAPNGTAAHIYVDRRYAARIPGIGRFLEMRPWVGRAFGPDQLMEAACHLVMVYLSLSRLPRTTCRTGTASPAVVSLRSLLVTNQADLVADNMEA
jgi:hypothetical protein